MVNEGDDRRQIGIDVDDDVVGKTAEGQTTEPAAASGVSEYVEWDDVQLEQIEGRLDSPIEIGAEARLLLLVPVSRGDRFLGRRREQPNAAHQMAERMARKR